MEYICLGWNDMIDFISIDGIIKVLELSLTFWGISIASRGLSTWREQVIETPKIELAREIMENFYNVVDTIKGIRRNLRTPYHEEIRKYIDKKDLNDIQCTFLEPLYEIQQNMELFTKFSQLKNKARVNFGNDIDDCFIDIIKIINEIKDASKELCYYYDKNRSEDEREPDLIKKFRHIIYQRENDDINQILNCVIEKAEKHLKPLYCTRK